MPTKNKLTNSKFEIPHDEFLRSLAVFKKRGYKFKHTEKRRAQHLYRYHNGRYELAFFSMGELTKERISDYEERDDDFFGEIPYAEGKQAYLACSRELKKWVNEKLGQDMDFTIDLIPLEYFHHKDYTMWAKMPLQQKFYALDMNVCWLQMCVKLGYISKVFYDNWAWREEYKKVFQMFLPLLSSPKTVTEYENGEVVRKAQDRYSQAYSDMYHNVRAMAVNIMIDSFEIAGKENCLFVNVDEVGITDEDAFRKVCGYWKSLGLDYKVAECIKWNEKEFVYGDRLRSMSVS